MVVPVTIVAMLATFNAPLFFALSGLVGYQYAGVKESSIYVGYITSIFIITLLTYLYTCLKRPWISRSEAHVYAFFVFMLWNHGLWVLLDPASTKLVPDNLVLFVAFALPSIFAVRILIAHKAWSHFIRLVEVVAMVMAVGIVVAVVFPFLHGLGGDSLASGVSLLGGATTQAASYFAAFTFGLAGFYVFRAEKELRFSWLRTRLGDLSNMLLMAGLVVATIVNGGRGAFVLLVVYSVLIFYWIATKRGVTYRGVIRFMLVLAALPVIYYVAYRSIISHPALEPGFRRAVAFIGAGGTSGVIDIAAGGSGRDVFYQLAIAGILDSPIWGYGAFGHWDRVVQPHNLFLDLALQFGIPLAMVILVSVIVWLSANRSQWDSYKCFTVVVGLYPLVALMFSGGYFMESMFWLALVGFVTVNHRPARTRLRPAGA